MFNHNRVKNYFNLNEKGMVAMGLAWKTELFYEALSKSQKGEKKPEIVGIF